MTTDRPHKTTDKNIGVIKFVLFGISILTFLSAIFIPWGLLTKKEIIISFLVLLSINGFLLWLFYLQYRWRQLLLQRLERQYKVEIVARASGSYAVEGDVSFLKKFSILLLLFSYFLIGILSPIALLVAGVFLME